MLNININISETTTQTMMAGPLGKLAFNDPTVIKHASIEREWYLCTTVLDPSKPGFASVALPWGLEQQRGESFSPENDQAMLGNACDIHDPSLSVKRGGHGFRCQITLAIMYR